MPAFEYTALDAKGKETRGVLEGDTPKQIRQQLRDKKLTPLSVEETNNRKNKSGSSKKNHQNIRGLKSGELAMLTRQIATLSMSGTPLEETLALVSQQSERQKVKSLVMGVRSRVLEGHTLADSLAEYPRIFPELYRATVSAGEQSGHLDGVLERLADYTEEQQESIAQVKKALIYPFALALSAILIIGVLMSSVVPKIVGVFTTQEIELPVATQILISVSDFFANYGLWLFLASVLAAITFSYAMRNEGFKYKVHIIALRIPLAGKLIRNFNCAQFARTLSILAASGVPVLQSLSIAAQVITNRPMRASVGTAAQQVREGRSLAKSLERTTYFPPMLIHMIASGEASGELDKMLERGALQQEREVNRLTSAFVGLLGPIIILLMGGLVFAIVVAMLFPMLKLNTLV